MPKISNGEDSYKYKIMSSILKMIENDILPPVFMCIGSDSVSGDILGPKVGDLLTHKYNIKAFVYGTMQRPLTAANVINIHNFIRQNHTASKIFAIDSSLGKEEDNGTISIYKGALRPAAAMKKELPPIGDYSLTANVNAFSEKNIVALESTRLNFVYEIAENIAFGINDALSLQKVCRLSNAI